MFYSGHYGSSVVNNSLIHTANKWVGLRRAIIPADWHTVTTVDHNDYDSDDDDDDDDDDCKCKKT